VSLLAVSDVWIGVIGTAIGGLIGVLSSWLVHVMQRADTIAERTRTERSEAYKGLLMSAEDSLHRFQWLAEGRVRPTTEVEDKRQEANYFYDREVTPRYMVLKIFGPQKVIDASKALRDSLNAIRKLVVTDQPMPSNVGKAFEQLQTKYRDARDAFIDIAGADLEPEPRGLRAWIRKALFPRTTKAPR
jgi:hypothetical protein